MEHARCEFCEKIKITPFEALALRKLRKKHPRKAEKILEKCCSCEGDHHRAVGFVLAAHLPSRGGAIHNNTRPGLDFYDRREG